MKTIIQKILMFGLIFCFLGINANMSYSLDRDVSIEDIRLVGILSIDGVFEAIVENKVIRNSFFLSIDERIYDFIVKDITEDILTLEKDSKIFLIKLTLKKTQEASHDQDKIEALTKELPQEEPGQKIKFRSNVTRSLRSGIPQKIKTQ